MTGLEAALHYISISEQSIVFNSELYQCQDDPAFSLFSPPETTAMQQKQVYHMTAVKWHLKYLTRALQQEKYNLKNQFTINVQNSAGCKQLTIAVQKTNATEN